MLPGRRGVEKELDAQCHGLSFLQVQIGNGHETEVNVAQPPFFEFFSPIVIEIEF